MGFSSESHAERNVPGDWHRQAAASRVADASDVFGAPVRVVRYYQSAGSQPRLEQRKHLRIQTFRSIKENEVDRSRHIARECLQRITGPNLNQVVEPCRDDVGA